MHRRSGWRKTVLLASLVAALGLLVAASPVSARPVGGTVILLVTDCRTGAPIRAGEADFALPHLATAVAPITDGQVGPVGLGQAKFVIVLSSPGYHELRRVVHSAGDLSQVQTFRFCLHAVAGSPEHLVTTSYSVDITAPFETSIVTNNIVQLQFTSAATNCSAIQVDLSVDGSTFTSDTLAPGDSTPIVDFTPVGSSSHIVDVLATGGSGCNTSGILTVTTALPFGPLNREVCKGGGWQFFTSPAFRSQGEC